MDTPRKTAFEQLHFFEQCLEKYTQATTKVIETKFYYKVGGTIVCLAFAGDKMIPLFTPALAHLQIGYADSPDVTFCIWDSESTGVAMVQPPCDWSAFTDRGDIWGFNSQRIRTAFHWGEFSLNVMDLERNVAVYWVETADTMPYWAIGSPMRTLFHWWMEKNGAQLLHAAAIGTEEGAVVITGKGGVGKSTSALSSLQAGLFYLSDDYLIIKDGDIPTVYSLYSTAKLSFDDLHKFPDLAPYVSEPMKEDQEKALLFLWPELKDRIINELPLRAILTPIFSDKPGSSLKVVPFWTMQGNMSFTTMSQLPYAGKHTHDYISRLCAKLPIHSLELGRDASQIPETLRQVIHDPLIGGDIHFPDEAEAPGQRPLISIVMPVYNGAAFIREAIENIISQKYPAIELIIVNDGSTDDSEAIIEGLGIDHRYFYQENDGPASARNRGIRNASGEYIAFLDVDDLWPANNLHRLIREIQSDPSLMVVHGYAQLMERMEEDGEYEYTGNPAESFPGYIGAGLYRKEAFDVVGLFDPFMKFGEDADWFKRAGELEIPLQKLKEVTLFVRRHGGNMTQGKNLVELNALKVFKKSLDRLRHGKTVKVEPAEAYLPVTVIIPCYNAENYLGEALESILQQKRRPEEIIVVDDGSMDSSVRIARSYEPHIRLIRQENKGAAAARNNGIAEAKSPFLSFLDADDVWVNEMPSLLYDLLISDSALDMAFGSVEQFVSPELEDHQKAGLREELVTMPGYLMGAMLIRRESFDKVGKLDESLNLAEFIDWMSKADQKGLKHKVLGDLVMRRRLHTTNQGLTKKEHMQDYTAVVRAALKRKRETNENES